MDGHTLFALFALLLTSQISEAIWRCGQDSDCDSLVGSVCNVATGACECVPGQQPVLGGSACVHVAPYLSSPCMESHQCSRLFTAFECRRRNQTDNEGNCFCAPGHHYLKGRCWPKVDFGGVCTRDEECLGAMRNPFSMTCQGTCRCADGYYERQRGDCRKIGAAVGEPCVVDVDCQFDGGACDVLTLRCVDRETNATTTTEEPLLVPEQPTKLTQASVSTTQTVPSTTMVPRVVCNGTTSCELPFECHPSGVCICPVGYYESDDGRKCLAELGSPAEPGQCAGLLAVTVDGICTCPPNFFFEENMRDCVRATRRFTDSCVSDSNCHTFGPATRCGPPAEPWGFRQCECIPEYAVWDPRRSYCRQFVGIGGVCEVDNDCLAGEIEVQCVKNENQDLGVCSCPVGLEEFEGLCLTSGLELGDQCQHSRECNAVSNAVCNPVSQLCDCEDGYLPNDGVCSPVIGGVCVQDSDCVIENTECSNGTCECEEAFLAYQDACWPEVSGFNAPCSVTPQCVRALGDSAVCDNDVCACSAGHHFRNGKCWPVTRLMESCTTVSQCYLPGVSDRVVCRNGLCQCDFRFPFSEELQTCLNSSAESSVQKSVYLLLLALFILLK